MDASILIIVGVFFCFSSCVSGVDVGTVGAVSLGTGAAAATGRTIVDAGGGGGGSARGWYGGGGGRGGITTRNNPPAVAIGGVAGTGAALDGNVLTPLTDSGFPFVLSTS